MDKKQFVIIGLDGVRLDVVRKFADDLPHLSSFIDTGTYGTLESVLPGPHSSAAWTSFSTGANPGKHGIGDWRSKTGYDFHPVTGDDIKPPRFWETLSDAGKTVGVFNIPLTSPPEPVRGVSVTSWTSVSGQFASPSSFQAKLENIDYKRQADFLSHDDEVSNLLYSIERRGKGVELFCDEFDWDLLVAMFYETEQAHHQFAPFIDQDHPLHDPKEIDSVRRVYKAVDEEIGKIRARVGPQTPFIVMSDHGFCPIYERIHVNRVLQQHGYYEPPKTKSSSSNKRPLSLMIDRLKHNNIVRRAFSKSANVPFLNSVVGSVISSYRQGNVGKSIQADWSRTQAFNGYAHGGIFLNTRASNPEGIVAENEIAGLSDQIIDSLESDEYLGPRIEGLYNRNDIFTGEHVNKLPHVILKFKDGYIGSTGYGEKISRGAEELRSNGKTIGFHTMAGLFLASGGKIRSTGISGLSIMDLAPTVLHYFEEPVPEHYDGTVITEMFKTDSDTAARPIEKSRIKFDKEGREQSAEDISKIEERLQDMGYM